MKMAHEWTHDRLLEDFCDIKGVSFRNAPLGSVWGGIYSHDGTPIADGLTIKPSYTRFCVTIYEIKASRGDLLSDLRREKWRKYLPHCHRLYFVCPSGIVKKGEIPDPAGLIVRGDKGYGTAKQPIPHNEDVPYGTLMALLFQRQRERLRERRLENIEYWGTYYYRKHLARQLGKKLAKAYGKLIEEQR